MSVRSAPRAASKRALGVPLLAGCFLVLAQCIFPQCFFPQCAGRAYAANFEDALPPTWSATVIAEGLAGPVAVAPAPDGRVYVAERLTGSIRVIERGRLLPEPVATLVGVAAGERGLLGLCADPQLARGDHGLEVTLFAYHTPALDTARIVRLRLLADRAAPPRLLERSTIIDGLPVAGRHNGGALAFGVDRHLYFSIGDLGDPEGTRRETSLAGRIHRIALDGSTPEDNPYPGRTEFCRGLRNCFGLTPLPDVLPTVLYLTDNGTREGDEVNRAVAGDHLGWPDGVGDLGRRDRVDPIHTWSPTSAPVGITTLDGELFIEEISLDGDETLDAVGTTAPPQILYGEFVTGRIVRLRLDADGRSTVSAHTFLERGPEPMFAVASDRHGHVWFASGSAVGRIRPAGSAWIRGDLDGNGTIDPIDLQILLAHLDDGSTLPCPAAADIDADGVIGPADSFELLQFFKGERPRLPAPFDFCGEDPTTPLPCPEHSFCG